MTEHRIDLVVDEEGILWRFYAGDDIELGHLGQYNYSEDRTYTDKEVIEEAIAESTDEEEGTYRLLTTGGHVELSGGFTQGGPFGVTIEWPTTSEAEGETESEDERS